MASIKFGSIVTDAKGKLGGHILQGNLSGSILSTKRNGAGQKSLSVSPLFLCSSAIASAWGGLTSDQKEVWKLKASLFPFTNKFGDRYIPSAYSLFVKLNSGLYMLGKPLLTDAPDPVAPCEPCTFTPTMVKLPFSLSIAFSPSPFPANFGVLIWFSKGYSAGTAESNTDTGRSGGTLDGGDTTPQDKSNDYEEEFNPDAFIQVGDVVYFNFSVISLLSGQRSGNYLTSLVVS